MYINLITIDLCPGQSGGGVTPSGTLNITYNGDYDVYSYHSLVVLLYLFKSNYLAGIVTPIGGCFICINQ